VYKERLCKLTKGRPKWRSIFMFFRVLARKKSKTPTKLNTTIIPKHKVPLWFFHINSSETYAARQSDKLKLWIHLQQAQQLTQLFMVKILPKFINTPTVIPTYLLPYLIFSAKSIKWKRFYIIHSNEILEKLYLSLWLKNLTLFMQWLKHYFEKRDLKKHKKLFLLLITILGKLIWGYNSFLQLRGLRVTLRGKFGKAGSVRKTRKYIKRGRYSYTSKNIAFISQAVVIKTKTGVFSIKLEVFF
jgi:hypothetical protein